MPWNLQQVDTSGASAETASQDGLSAGIYASETMAQTDLHHLRRCKPTIQQVAQKTAIDSAIIAAIISRETRGGPALRSDGFGQYDPNGYGLMQVDKRWYSLEGEPESQTHMRQATKILKGMIKQIKEARPNWTNEQVLKGGIAAYNGGVNGVLGQSYGSMDACTTGRDYSSDVVARAKYLMKNGFANP